jgi:hypothetical protein
VGILKYVRLYTGSDGESHFEDVEALLTDSGRGTDVSEEIPAVSFNFAKFRDDYAFEQHTAPRRRLVVILAGSIEVEASDGEIRILGPDTILLAEDTTGMGHRSRATGNGERLSLYVQLE